MLLDLTGKKILVTGIANNRSIAWGIAQQLKAAGAELGITYLPDDKGRFEAKVRELTAPLEPSLFLPLNVQDAAQMESVFAEIKEKWGVLDGLVHCLAFAGKDELIGNYSNISPEGFARALEVSAYSLAPLCKHAKPLFSEGASVITLSYLGAERAIPNYNVMAWPRPLWRPPSATWPLSWVRSRCASTPSVPVRSAPWPARPSAASST